MNSLIIEDTYAEAFSTKAAHLLITAATRQLAKITATEATGFATSFISSPAEAELTDIIHQGKLPMDDQGIQ